MKIPNLLAIISILLFFIACTESKPKTDWDEKNLKGKVKSITEKEYKAEEKFGEVVKTDTLLSLTTYSFNENGFIVSEEYVEYEPVETKQGYKHTYEYNERGLKVKKNESTLSGKLMKSYVFEYDEQGNIIQKNEYDSDGKLKVKAVYEDGLENNQTRYNSDGKIIVKEIFKYNDERLIIEQALYESTGSLGGMYTYDYIDLWVPEFDEFSKYIDEKYTDRLPADKRKNKGGISLSDFGSQSSAKKSRFVTQQIFINDSNDKQEPISYYVYDSKTKLVVETGKPEHYDTNWRKKEMDEPIEKEEYYYNDKGDISMEKCSRHIETTEKYIEGLKIDNIQLSGTWRAKTINHFIDNDFTYIYDKVGNWTYKTRREVDRIEQWEYTKGKDRYQSGYVAPSKNDLRKNQLFRITEREITYY